MAINGLEKRVGAAQNPGANEMQPTKCAAVLSWTEISDALGQGKPGNTVFSTAVLGVAPNRQKMDDRRIHASARTRQSSIKLDFATASQNMNRICDSHPANSFNCNQSLPTVFHYGKHALRIYHSKADPRLYYDRWDKSLIIIKSLRR